MCILDAPGYTECWSRSVAPDIVSVYLGLAGARGRVEARDPIASFGREARDIAARMQKEVYTLPPRGSEAEGVAVRKRITNPTSNE